MLTGCASGATTDPTAHAAHHEAAASPTPASPTPGAAQPYAGLQGRTIKALDPQRASDLLVGKGLGYAQAAELNHYPGPAHALQFAAQLDLTPDQERATRDIFAAMDADAKRLGQSLVDQERELDGLFAAGRITPTELTRLTGAIAATEGQLREVHLGAHLKMKALLTPEQIARYDQLRGYTAADGASATGTPLPGDHHP